MREIYLCRHGETEWTIAGRHTGKTDIPLTKRGEDEAREMRRRLEAIHFEKVITSPRKRAIETCQGMHAVVEPLAVEWDYGDYEGMTTAEIRKVNPSWNLFTDGAPNGESPEEVGQRADLLLEKIKTYQGNVALFSHGHFLRVFAARYLGLKPKEARLFLLSVASVSILGTERGQPAVALWNGH